MQKLKDIKLSRKVVVPAAITATALGVFIAGSSLVMTTAYAAENNPPSNLIQKLASKLGIEQSKLQEAFSASTRELSSERTAQAKTAISEAVTSGKLTQAQADILTAELEIETARMATPPTDADRPTRIDLSALTEEQRKAKFDELKVKRDAEMVEALKEKGVTATAAEIEAAHKAAQDAGLRVGLVRHAHPGPGGDFIMMTAPAGDVVSAN